MSLRRAAPERTLSEAIQYADAAARPVVASACTDTKVCRWQCNACSSILALGVHSVRTGFSSYLLEV